MVHVPGNLRVGEINTHAYCLNIGNVYLNTIINGHFYSTVCYFLDIYDYF